VAVGVTGAGASSALFISYAVVSKDK